MNRIGDKIVPDSIWVLRPRGFDLSTSDIISKVIRVTEDRVFLIRKTDFGFTDLAPEIMKIEEFINNYLYLGQMKF